MELPLLPNARRLASRRLLDELDPAEQLVLDDCSVIASGHAPSEVEQGRRHLEMLSLSGREQCETVRPLGSSPAGRPTESVLRDLESGSLDSL